MKVTRFGASIFVGRVVILVVVYAWCMCGVRGINTVRVIEQL